VYGFRQPRARWPISEDAPLEGPLAYAKSKIAAERHVRAAARTHDLDYVILRPSVVYSGTAPFFEKLVEHVTRHPLRAAAQTAEATTQPIYARDLCDALVLAGTSRGPLCKTVNAVGAEHVPLRHLIHLIANALGDTTFESVPHWARRELREIKYDLRGAQEALGFHPTVTLEKGVSEAVAAICAVWTNVAPGPRRSWQDSPARLGRRPAVSHFGSRTDLWPRSSESCRTDEALGMAGSR
jgi:nucleoside-diphosphate-sugar epimerase